MYKTATTVVLSVASFIGNYNDVCADERIFYFLSGGDRCIKADVKTVYEKFRSLAPPTGFNARHIAQGTSEISVGDKKLGIVSLDLNRCQIYSGIRKIKDYISPEWEKRIKNHRKKYNKHKNTCPKRLELQFDILSHLEWNRNLDVTSSNYKVLILGIGKGSSVAFVSPRPYHQDTCLGGTYKYSYTATTRPFFDEETRTYSGSFQVGDNVSICFIVITQRNGNAYIRCQ